MFWHTFFFKSSCSFIALLYRCWKYFKFKNFFMKSEGGLQTSNFGWHHKRRAPYSKGNYPGNAAVLGCCFYCSEGRFSCLNIPSDEEARLGNLHPKHFRQVHQIGQKFCPPSWRPNRFPFTSSATRPLLKQLKLKGDLLAFSSTAESRDWSWTGRAEGRLDLREAPALWGNSVAVHGRSGNESQVKAVHAQQIW